MSSSKSDTRLRQAFQSLSEGARPTESCPTPEALWQAVSGESPLEERRAVVTHTSSCFSCAEDWRLAKAANEEWGAAGGEAPASRPTAEVVPMPAAARPAWRRQILSLAAVLGLAVVGLGIFQWSRPSDPDPIFRQADESAVRSLLGEDAELPRENVLLRWSEAEEGVRYDLLVVGEDLREVLRAEDLEEPRYLIPPEALAGQSDGVKLLWRVGSTDSEGRRRESETFEFRLVGEAPSEGADQAEKG